MAFFGQADGILTGSLYPAAENGLPIASVIVLFCISREITFYLTALFCLTFLIYTRNKESSDKS